jgi:hypothetical protein
MKGSDSMFVMWDEAKEKYPNKWIVLKNPQYADRFGMELVGGELVSVTNDIEEMENSIPNDGGHYASRNTWEDKAVGILKSGCFV